MISKQTFKDALRVEGVSKKSIYTYTSEFNKIERLDFSIREEIIKNPEAVCGGIKKGEIKFKVSSSTYTVIRRYAKFNNPNFRLSFSFKCHGIDELSKESQERIKSAIDFYNLNDPDKPIDGFKIEKGCIKLSLVVKVVTQILRCINTFLDLAESLKETKQTNCQNKDFFDLVSTILGELLKNQNLVSISFVNDDYIISSVEAIKLINKIISIIIKKGRNK